MSPAVTSARPERQPLSWGVGKAAPLSKSEAAGTQSTVADPQGIDELVLVAPIPGFKKILEFSSK